MQLIIAAVGKLRAGPERELYEHYAGRIGGVGKLAKLGPLTEIVVSESRKGDANQRRGEEARTLLSKIPDSAEVVLLEEKGKALSSPQFASLIGKLRDSGASAVVLALGGADGHGSELRHRATRTFSLGAITLPHGLARVVLAEQLYRAATILAGHPYHRR